MRADVDPAVAVIVLDSDAGELALLRAFAAGCDDYLACPPSYPELRARIDALTRRAGLRGAEPKRHGGLSIDPHRRIASYSGRPLALSATEFALLNHLAADPERCFTKHELLRDVWGIRDSGSGTSGLGDPVERAARESGYSRGLSTRMMTVPSARQRRLDG